MKRKIIAAILLPLVTFFSCSKESGKVEANKASEKIKLSSNTQNWSAAANSGNPYDYVGIEHNKAAQHLVENLSYGDLPNTQITYNATKTYVASQYGSAVATEFNTNTSVALLNNIMSNVGTSLPTANNYAAIINMNTNLSATAKTQINNLINQILNSTNTVIDYNYYKSMVMSWEGNINNINVSQNDKKAMYMFASVLRHSLLLWKDVEYPDSGSEHLQLYKFKIKLFGWVATGLVDAVVGVAAAFVVTPVLSGVLAAGASGGTAAVCGINNW